MPRIKFTQGHTYRGGYFKQGTVVDVDAGKARDCVTSGKAKYWTEEDERLAVADVELKEQHDAEVALHAKVKAAATLDAEGAALEDEGHPKDTQGWFGLRGSAKVE